MEERAPETKRRARLGGPPLAFLATILGIATVVIIVLLIVYFAFGFGADGAEGP